MPTPILKCRSPRRVLQVITPTRMSGAERQFIRMTAHMTARGHAMSTVVNRSSNSIAEIRSHGMALQSKRIGGPFGVLTLPVLVRAARTHEAEIIQCASLSASRWAGWLERCGGPPSIGHVQEFVPAASHRHQTHLLAISKSVKQHLVTQGIPVERLTVLHSAISPDEFYPTRDPLIVRAEQGAEADTPVVGAFAQLSEDKGHFDLLAAVPSVLRTLPKAQFWFVGQGELWHELRELADSTGVANNVRFLGYRHDVADLMNATNVVASPSHRDPFASVCIEAALLRKPSVACRTGGTPELVDDAQTGLLLPTHDNESISEALLTLLTNRDRSARMGQVAYERAVGLFGWDRFIHTLEQVYERVLDERAGSYKSTYRVAA